MSEATYSTSTAAKKLSISQHYFRRLLESGLVDCDQTHTAQSLISSSARLAATTGSRTR